MMVRPGSKQYLPGKDQDDFVKRIATATKAFLDVLNRT
jgi:hypothetical protein